MLKLNVYNLKLPVNLLFEFNHVGFSHNHRVKAEIIFITRFGFANQNRGNRVNLNDL